MSNVITESPYAEVDKKSKSSKTSKLVRKDAIRNNKNRAKPPLPPVCEYSDGLSVRKKVSKSVFANIEDGTSISDDLESDTRSLITSSARSPHQSRMHFQRRSASNSSKNMLNFTFHKLDDAKIKSRSYQMTKPAINTSSMGTSDASDSGIFHHDFERENSEEEEVTINKKDLQDLPIQLQHLINLYQRRLNSNVDVIKSCEEEVNELRKDRNMILGENASLKQLMEELKRGYPGDIEEWKLLREQAELVLEENDNMHRQLQVMREKLRENQTTCKEQVVELMGKLEISDDRFSVCQAELNQVRKRYDSLRGEYNLLLLNAQDMMPKDDHSQLVRESKRLLVDLKSKYDQDVQTANDMIRRLQNEKSTFTTELASVKNENEQLHTENEVLILGHKKDLNTIRHLRKTLAKLKNENVKMYFNLKMVHNQNKILQKEKTRVTNSTFAQIENAVSQEANVRHLMMNKMALLEELQRQVLRNNAVKEEQSQMKRLQHNLDEAKRKLKKLKEGEKKSSV